MPECTIGTRDGRFCWRPAVADAPFPICEKHLREAWLFGRDHFVEQTSAALDRAREQWAAEAPPVTLPDTNRVYYLRVGELIKIGTTTHLRSRLRGYPPGTTLLATEVGDTRLEAKRLEQFRAWRVHGREWFTPNADLESHVRLLAETETAVTDRAELGAEG